MKKFICLAQIVIVILSGCKGNSFLTQRYTNFSHVSHKADFEQTPADHTKYLRAERKAEVQVKENKKAESVAASLPVQIVKNEQVTTFNNVGAETKETNAKRLNETVLNDQQFGKTTHKENFSRSKKTIKERFNHLKGLIGATLSLVVYIVILAIIVGVIIILLLLV